MTRLFSLTLAFIQTTENEKISLINLLIKASPIAQAVLVILLLFSIASWVIIFSKWAALRNAEAATARFISRFRTRSKLSDALIEAESEKASPIARIFIAGYEEIAGQMSGAGAVRSLDSVSRVLQSATIAEVTRLERSLGWLATTANASPFIGLFGTVVGIVIAFQGLSAATASSIQSVAPGIAEALIATAAGIAAAVPAAIFYNYLLNKVKSLTATMDRFSLDLLNLIERHYIKADV